MKIAIISDVHNNDTNLKKVLDYCAKEEIKTIICCGDLASNETLDFLNDNFAGEIHYALGNMDNEQLQEHRFDKKYKNTNIFENVGEAEISGKKVAFVHYPWIADKLARSGKYKFVFYGHTHKPWTEKVGECEMLNPGNVAGDIYPPTFAVWNTDDDKFELIRVHDLQ
ncbi:YfcE family phosphodiesterase [Patescibacteria group bacterium]|nr:MAG: YfcE family phosphodiesterase [Patescibacteria group bacterium]